MNFYHPLTYGLKDGELISVKNVKNGLACECVCPNCGAKLIARNNCRDKMDHFAHYKSIECVGAVETAIHLLAKQIFLKEKAIVTPDFYYYSDTLKFGDLIYKSRIIQFDRVELEKRENITHSHFVPDAIGYIGENKIFIEFAVTHFIDESKAEKIKNSGVPCVEINLSGIDLDEKRIKEVLMEKLRKEWISYPQLENQANRILSKIKKEKEELILREKNRLIKEQLEKDKIAEQKLSMYQFHRDFNCFQLTQILNQCPRYNAQLKTLKATDHYNHSILKRIIDGENWKGDIYGKIYNGHSNGKWIYLKNQQYYIYPPDSDYDVSHKKVNDIFWGGLQKILRFREDIDCESCKSCKELFEYKTIKYVVCGFPKEY